MTVVDLSTAQQQLGALIEAAQRGEAVVIIRADGAQVQLIPVARQTPVFGSAAGLITIRDDFDEPLPEFEDN